MLYACNACNYLFENEGEKPLSCPSCHASSVVYGTDTGKKVSIQAIRTAAPDEISAYAQIGKEVSDRKSFLEQVKCLQKYTLSVDEYNMALMLLFFYKTSPVFYTKIAIDRLLSARKSGSDQESWQEETQKYYYDVRRHFTSSLTTERRNTGTNDTAAGASYTEADSAANTLMKFREDVSRSGIRELFGETPNLGDVRRVDYKTVAIHPGEGYREFLQNWYNSLPDDGATDE